MNEKWIKFQGKPGEANHQARLVTADVDTIRAYARLGLSDTEIGARMNVARGTVWHARTRSTWSHVS